VEPCKAFTQVTNLLDTQHQHLVSTLGASANVDAVLVDLGLGLQVVVLDHVKKFCFSTAGGMQLLRDLSALKTHVAKYRSSVVDDAFDMLRQVASLFLVPLEALRSVTEEPSLQRLPPKDLQSLIRLRADFQPSRFAKLLGVDMDTGMELA